MANSTLFSNHGHVLLFLSQHPDARLRDVAGRVGITERAVQKIVRDLQDEGLLDVTKRGRRNRYRVNTRKSLQQPLGVRCTVGSLVALFRGRPESAEKAAGPEPVRPDAAPSTRVAAEKPKPAKRSTPPQSDKGAGSGSASKAKKKRSRKKRPADDQQGSLF